MTNSHSSFDSYIVDDRNQRTINECINNIIYSQYGGFEIDEINKVHSISEMRESARDYLVNLKNYTLSADQKNSFISLFQNYCSTVKKRQIVLAKNYLKSDINSSQGIRNEIHNQHSPEFRVMPFKTRFTSYSYMREALAKYDNFWEYMELANYKQGVFLTVTVDTKRVSDRIESNKACAKGLNKLLTSFRTAHKKKFDYICVPEFTKKGFLHFHLVFFGTPHIDDIKHIQKLWNEKYNIAIQTDIQGMEFKNGRWKSLRRKKKSFKSWKDKQIPDLQDYLQKYLKKNFFNSSNCLTDDKDLDYSSAMFWTLNRRWFSTSRIKITNHPQQGLCLLNALRLIQEPTYSYWGSYNCWELIPDYIRLKIDDT